MVDKAVNAPAPPPPRKIQRRSVQETPFSLEAGPGGGNAFVLWMASIADTFEPWGRDVINRDRQLRDFWHTESFLSGAVYSCAISNASFEWELDGPEQTVEAVHDVLSQAHFGKGFEYLAKKLSVDLYTQDNGAFIEVIRQRNSASAPVLGISHLDAARCQRTGDLQFPVIYTDIKGSRHKMPWYSVVMLEEFPSPIESMHGVQYSAVTRVLRAAQILRDMAIYRGEKAGGRFTEAIHLVGGVKTSDIEDVKKRTEEQADNQGLVRYLAPMIIGSLDPQAQPRVATIELKSLPENFDYDDELRWYISSLALGFGRDYQDFAPLPSGNLGTSTQSEVLHLKTRGKGPAAFMRLLEQGLNFHGVMPQSVTFRFKEQDIQAEKQEADVRKTRAETRQIRIESFEISPQIARQIAADDGDLDQEYLEALGEADLTPGKPVEGSERPEDQNGRAAPMLAPEPVTAMLDNLTAKAKDYPELRRYLEESAREVTREPLLNALAQTVKEVPEVLRSELLGALEKSISDLSDSTQLSLQEIAESLHQSLDDRVREIESQDTRRAKAVHLAMAGLNESLKRMASDRKGRKSAERTAAEMKEALQDSTLVEKTVLERDEEGHMKIVRMKYASGRVQDFEAVRDRKGFLKKLREVR